MPRRKTRKLSSTLKQMKAEPVRMQDPHARIYSSEQLFQEVFGDKRDWNGQTDMFQEIQNRAVGVFCCQVQAPGPTHNSYDDHQQKHKVRQIGYPLGEQEPGTDFFRYEFRKSGVQVKVSKDDQSDRDQGAA